MGNFPYHGSGPQKLVHVLFLYDYDVTLVCSFLKQLSSGREGWSGNGGVGYRGRRKSQWYRGEAVFRFTFLRIQSYEGLYVYIYISSSELECSLACFACCQIYLLVYEISGLSTSFSSSFFLGRLQNESEMCACDMSESVTLYESYIIFAIDGR